MRVLIFLILVFIGSFAKAQVEGLYKSNGEYINLTDSTFLYCCKIKKQSGEIVPDTISFGSWTMDESNEFIVLTSTNRRRQIQYFNSIGGYSIDEGKGFSPDSIYLFLNCPAAELGLLWSLDGYIEYLSMGSAIVIPKREFNPSTFAFVVSPFLINNDWIKPEYLQNYSNNRIGSLIYKSGLYLVKDKESNIFRISIPGLTEFAFREQSLNEEYVKLLQGTIGAGEALKWRGSKYVKCKNERLILSPTGIRFDESLKQKTDFLPVEGKIRVL